MEGCGKNIEKCGMTCGDEVGEPPVEQKVETTDVDGKVEGEGGVAVEMAASKKKKKRKEKTKKPVVEEDDLDKIIAELGEVTVSVLAPVRGPVAAEAGSCVHADANKDDNPDEKDAGEGKGVAESSLGKKKKKKKEKDKKAAAIAAEEMKGGREEIDGGKPFGRKMPKHVRQKLEELARRKEEEERKKMEEEERVRMEEEERRRQEELERLEEEKRKRKKEKEKEKRQKKQQEGKPLTSKQKEEVKKREAFRNAILAQVGNAPSVHSTPSTSQPRQIGSPAKSALKKGDDINHEIESDAKETGGYLRSPICCIFGHVDTGKTKLLDCIRGTNVQGGEAGGITQQIGATYIPTENIRERTKDLKADAKLLVPGLLVIDTPGHEAFANLRSRGSSLCDIAILVVDIMHGLKPQTIESLNLLRTKGAEFIIALNKVDRLYGWKTCPNSPILKALEQQKNDVREIYEKRVTQIIEDFKKQGLNTKLYYENKKRGETFSIVPTSAVSGEGVPDLLLVLVQWAQRTMEENLAYVDKVQCTVLEVRAVEGLGTTIDVVLVNGILRAGDQIVVCGMQGPIVTGIRALLTPHPMKELRVKGSYLHHKELKAALGIKITAQGLEQAVAGTSLYVVDLEDDLEKIKEVAMQDMNGFTSLIDRSGDGVCVQASTLGSLEALLEFLKTPEVNIPVSGINIGPVDRKDVMKAIPMLERKKEFASILAFDVKVTRDARALAEEYGVKIFTADIIYHLFDQFKAHIDNLKDEKKREAAEEAVFPCILKIMPNCIFNKKDPIVLGIDVLEGIARVGTPVCIPSRDFIDIGQIASIEINHKQVDFAKKGQKVAIKIVASNLEEQQKIFGRHFDIQDELYSHLSRRSIDALKVNYRDDLTHEEWKLVAMLKKKFCIL